MDDPRGRWRVTTHDWTARVDAGHLAAVHRAPDTFAPGGVLHLVLEVLATRPTRRRAPAGPGAAGALVGAWPHLSIEVEDRRTT